MKLRDGPEPEEVKNRLAVFPHECRKCHSRYWLEKMWKTWVYFGGMGFAAGAEREWICHRCSPEKPEKSEFER